MRKFYFTLMLVAAVLGVSCMKDLGNGRGPVNNKSEIPGDFNWKMTRDVTVSVGMPSVDGVVPEYAVVRVYLNPMISEQSVVAKGVLSAANPSCRTVMTIPAGVAELYVKTTLPDGTASVRSIAVTGSQVNVPGETMQPASPLRSFAVRAESRKASSMPTDYPAIPKKGAGDFDVSVVIDKTPSTMYTLGADYVKWNPGQVAAPEYFIPSGAVIDGNIGLNGGEAPFRAPILYVAGTLNLSWANIGQATIAILKGGRVNVTGSLTAQNIGNAVNPAIYVFNGGELAASALNLSCRSVVSGGKIVVDGLLDMNNKLTLYNLADGTIEADKLIYSNSGGFYNDGTVTVDDFQMNSSVDFENCENGVLNFRKCTLEAGNTLVQKGTATIDRMTNRGKFYVNCYTYVNNMVVDGGFVYIASDACLETVISKFNNSQTELAAGSLFIADEYNAEGVGNGNKFINDANGTAVVRFQKKAVCAQGAKTDFTGKIEVVYDATGLGDKYQFDDKYVKNQFKKGAYLTGKQVVNIPASECNGGKGDIDPEPEEKPEDVETTGAVYTYCFEDGWPWMGDYDMNDVVILTSLDRKTSADGSKVSSIRINWEVKASGAINRIAAAVQLDKVAAGSVATVTGTHNTLGEGPFAGFGPEQGHKYAVLPLFNAIEETQPAGKFFFNTYKEQPAVETIKNSTTIIFTQPVDAEAVTESALNVFIVVNQPKGAISRSNEIHLPTYMPTESGNVSGFNSVMPSDPYKFFVAKGEASVNNGMMWGLMIPGDFRYPAERQDIRGVYSYFKDWAMSNGTQHNEWYLEDANEKQIY